MGEHAPGLTMFVLTAGLLVVVVLLRARIDPGTRERRALRSVGTEIWEWFARFERGGGRVQDLEGLSWGPALRARKVVWLAAAQLIGLLMLTAAIYLAGWPWWIPLIAALLLIVAGGYFGEARVFLADDTAATWRYEGSRGLLLLGLVVKGVVLCAGLGLVWLAADLLISAPALLALAVAIVAAVVFDRCHIPARAIEGVIRSRQSIGFAENATGETILYLRSFDDDTALVYAPVASTRWYAPVLPQRVRFEELVEAWTFNEAAHVVAIGRPGERRPSLGAGRSYWTDETWQEAVRRTAARCKAVIVVAGTTEGLGWEISTLSEMGVLGKTLLLLPPDTPENTEQRYRRITAASNREHDALVDDRLALSAIPAMGYTAGGELVHYVSFGRDWAAYVSAETHLLRTLSGTQQFEDAGNLTRLEEITEDPVAQAFALSVRMGRPGDGRQLLDDLLADGDALTDADRERVAIARAAALLAEEEDADLARAALPDRTASPSPALTAAYETLGSSDQSAEAVFRLVLPVELRETAAPVRHEKASTTVAVRLMQLWFAASEMEDKERHADFLGKAQAASNLAGAHGLELARAMSDVMVATSLAALVRPAEAEALARDVLSRDLPADGSYARKTFRSSDVRDDADAVLLDVIDRSTRDGRLACIRVLEAQYKRRRGENRRSDAAETARDLALWNVEEGTTAEADRWGDLAVKEFAALGNSGDQAQTLTTLARASLGARDHDTALARARAALALIDANMFIELKGDALYAAALAADGIAERGPDAARDDAAILAIRDVLSFDAEVEPGAVNREERLLVRLVARLCARARHKEAVQAQRRLVALRSERLGADDPHTLSERLQLARFLRDAGDTVQAETDVEELSRIAESVDITAVPDLREEILLTQAVFAESAGDIDGTVALLDAREASVASRVSAGAALGQRRHAIAVLADAKRNREALTRQQGFLDELRASTAPDAPELATAVESRNELEWRLSWGEAKVWEDGEDFAAAAARHETWLREQSFGGTRDAVRTAHSSAARGRCVSLAGRSVEAQQILRDGHARAAVDLGRTHEATRWFLTERARAYRRIGDDRAELAVLTELYTDEIAANGKADRDTILTMADLALVHDRLGDTDDARRFADLAVSNAVLVFGGDDPFTQRRRDALASLLPNDDNPISS